MEALREHDEQRRDEREYRATAVVGAVFYRVKSYNKDPVEVKVIRTTKTLLLMDDGAKVSRDHGRTVGDAGYSNIAYYPGCPHVVARFQREIAERGVTMGLLRAHQALLERLSVLLRDANTHEKKVVLTDTLTAFIIEAQAINLG